MKRKLLSDIDTMSGTGWQSEDIECECPCCGEEIITSSKQFVKCKHCKSHLTVEFGKQYFIRLSIEDNMTEEE